MKKAVVLLLAILYVTITSGVVVNIHYCMGRLASINYGIEKEKACEKCGMEQKKDCCHTEHKLIKADDEHLFVKEISSPAILISEASLVYQFNIDYTYRSRDHHYAQYHSPPDPRENSLNVYNCVFRV